MQELNLQGETSGGSSNSNTSSDDSQMLLVLRKMMKKEVELMVVHTVQQVIGPVLKDLISKVVKVEIQSAVEKYFTDRSRNDDPDETGMSKEKVLHLKFLNEVSSDVLTGKTIKAEGGGPIRVALFDETAGQIVRNGPESSGKVEILVLEADREENDCNRSLEEFNNRIIRDNDKKRPHFTKNQYVCLKEGVGILSDVKLGNDKSWTKNCLCRLGVRTVGNFHGVKVKEAWSGSFMVKDSRSNYNKKSYPPLLHDELWKLDNIGKDGPPCRRLNNATIMTVQHFLFLHHVDTKLLEKIADVHGLKWSATVNHAQTCVIDDKKIYIHFLSSSESKSGVAFDVVGRLKGIIRDSHYVPVTNLCQADKACQRNLLLSAFENREDLTAFDDETSLLQQYPYPSSELADTNDSSLGSDPCVSDLTIVGLTTNVQDPTEPESTDSLFGQSEMSEPCEPVLEDPNQVQSSMFSDLDPYFQNFGDNESLMAIVFGGSSSLSDSLWPDAQSYQQTTAGRNYWVRALAVMLWVLRARKRVTGQGDSRASKKQRIS